MMLLLDIQPDGSAIAHGHVPETQVRAFLAALEVDEGRSRGWSASVPVFGTMVPAVARPGGLALWVHQGSWYPYWLETAPDEWRTYVSARVQGAPVTPPAPVCAHEWVTNISNDYRLCKRCGAEEAIA
jgi:hypothetical protein